MLPAANRGAGQNLAFPDVCNTVVGPATVPVPYPNIALNAQATGFSTIVKVSMVNALNLASQIPMTSGDEAGAAHPTVKGAARYTMGNPIVMVEKMPGIMLTAMTTGNNMNANAGAVIVPSTANVLYTCAAPGVDRADTARRLDAARVSVSEPGTLRISAIDFDTPTLVERHVRRLAPDGVLTLDLRDNPGGRLDAALRLLDLFLPVDAPLCRVAEPDGDELLARARHDFELTLPLVVLVDENTGSAAELVAAVLSWHGRARVVGTATHGKASVQRYATDERGRSRYVTAARWRLPDGSDIEGRGVLPSGPTPTRPGPHRTIRGAVARRSRSAPVEPYEERAAVAIDLEQHRRAFGGRDALFDLSDGGDGSPLHRDDAVADA